MLRITYLPLILLITTFFACKNDPALQAEAGNASKEDTIRNETPENQEGTSVYSITSGTVTWSGKKANGDTHEGTILVESGALTVSNGKLQSGLIQMDMNTLVVTSIKDGGEKRDLESHLKDVDFFEVNKFPKASFQFDEVLPSDMQDFNHIIVGDLTIKQNTHGVNIPVQLKITGDDLTAHTPVFSINRTQWGINFRSGLLGTVKDKLIGDSVVLSIRLTAKRSQPAQKVPGKG